MTSRWYAVHAYSNFENKVADSIREQAKQRGLSSLFEEILVPKEKVVEVRHPDFFRGKPKLDQVEFWFMPDASSREMAFRKGEIDIVEGEREQAWVKKMREIPGTDIEIFGPGETLVLHFNMSKKPLDDVRIRKAICHAINSPVARLNKAASVRTATVARSKRRAVR